MSGAISRDCPAKVNIFLRVLAREHDGMHGLETLYCRVALADRLTITRRDRDIALDVSGADLGPAEENLVWRAADAVLAATGRRFGVHLRLEKRIPAGAGLGGGSSDAAAALEAVNTLAGNAIPRGELFHMAARLGADVPFFLSGAPLALAWGHGTRLLRLPPLPARPMLLLVPDTRVSTPEAYGWIDEIRAGTDRGSVALDLDLLGNWGDLARIAGNDFEAATLGRYPNLKAAHEALVGTGPLLCRMSGSGSGLFAVYRDARRRDDAIAQLGSGHGVLVATTNE